MRSRDERRRVLKMGMMGANIGFVRASFPILGNIAAAVLSVKLATGGFAEVQSPKFKGWGRSQKPRAVFAATFGGFRGLIYPFADFKSKGIGHRDAEVTERMGRWPCWGDK